MLALFDLAKFDAELQPYLAPMTSKVLLDKLCRRQSFVIPGVSVPCWINLGQGRFCAIDGNRRVYAVGCVHSGYALPVHQFALSAIDISSAMVRDAEYLLGAIHWNEYLVLPIGTPLEDFEDGAISVLPGFEVVEVDE